MNPEQNDESEDTPGAGPETLTPQEQAMLQALFAEPFAAKPYVLVPPGSVLTPEFEDYLMSEDDNTGNRCLFVFDSTVDAMAVAEAYQKAAAVELEPQECDIFSLPEDLWLQYFRSNGVIAVMPMTDYRQHVGSPKEEAIFNEPFPQKPYALIPAGTVSRPEDTEYIIHKDIATENQCVIIFDSIVDAFSVAEEYKQATGREAEPVECDVNSLEDRFWVKYYRSNGAIAQMPVTEYRKHIGTNHSYE